MKTVKSGLMAAVVALSAELLAGAVPKAYEKLWNASVNRGIDERIERYRKADAFRGFRGRYRLSWRKVDGTTASKVVEVK